MKRLLAATGNAHKIEEMQAILRGLDITLIPMKEAGISPEIVEDGETFAENALIKARAVCAASGEPALADDSGLVVDALGGKPGVYSSRWMGEDTSYHVKNAELVRLLQDVPDEKRTARFACVMACVFPDGDELTAEGFFEGRIGYEERGENGFGYDPVFLYNGRTLAEMTSDEKNAISHRGAALRLLYEVYQERYGKNDADK